MYKISLNGEWRLFGFEQGTHIVDAPCDLAEIVGLDGVISLSANVPEEAQLTLSRHGILPEDLFMGMNIRETEKFEKHEWWYERSFTVPALENGQKLFVEFEGADCLAEYFLNNELFAVSDNAMTGHEFEITHLVTPGENKLAVRFRSPLIEAYDMEYPLFGSMGINPESGHLRKPAHSFGWDIMPRAVTSGIWKDVNLVVKNRVEISQAYILTISCDKQNASLTMLYEIDCPVIMPDDDYKISIKGVCDNSVIRAEQRLFRHKSGRVYDINVSMPKLWWPHGYGEANLYDFEIILENHGVKVAEKCFKTGIRTARLIRTDVTDGVTGCFKFNVNGVDIMAKGSNWVPLDAFHSRDLGRVDKAMEMMADLECNIVRCWGGNVYESERFYDLCDKYGIMVWQDFGMACHFPPHTEQFKQQICDEVAYVVKARRHHPSIVLWAGDNEVDQMAVNNKLGMHAEINKITREVIPGELYRHERLRDYLESSPVVPKALYESPLGDFKAAPENHIWGPRDYFKSRFYTESGAHFISECGYHACPGRKSIEKFISPDKVWPYTDNEEWNLHSSDQKNRNHRVMLMEKQIRQFFATVPDNLDDYATASQFSQGEAKKFFIERMRCGKPTKSGIIWWNLLDGWPQMSDAIVDYYFEKKRAYDYIKRSQQPFCLMMGELESWNCPVIAANDTLDVKKGIYKVYELTESCEKVLIQEGRFDLEPNGIRTLTKIPVMYSDKRMFIMAWETDDGNVGYNHYLAGMPPFDLETYTKWMDILSCPEVGF